MLKKWERERERRERRRNLCWNERVKPWKWRKEERMLTKN